MEGRTLRDDFWILLGFPSTLCGGEFFIFLVGFGKLLLDASSSAWRIRGACASRELCTSLVGRGAIQALAVEHTGTECQLLLYRFAGIRFAGVRRLHIGSLLLAHILRSDWSDRLGCQSFPFPMHYADFLLWV